MCLCTCQAMVDGVGGSMLTASTSSSTLLPQAGILRPSLALAAVDACGSLFLLLGSSSFSKHMGQPLLNVLQKVHSCQKMVHANFQSSRL